MSYAFRTVTINLKQESGQVLNSNREGEVEKSGEASQIKTNPLLSFENKQQKQQQNKQKK